MLRRTFTAGLASAPMAMMASSTPAAKIGIDLFSVRSSGFNAFEFLDHSASLGAQLVHF
ncbi:MAG: sugar phosphate isomerase/epimerase, partial [Bryobacteraceae bacterium]|nr:sugar phosphate isomerase/epimerase [Bryobacteraceae bacterium]